MAASLLLPRIAAELALFAGSGFLLFALDDLAVDLVYFARRFWRSATVYRRHPRMDARRLPAAERSGWIAVFVPAWDEAAVIGPMLRSALARFEHPDYRILVGYYRNDEPTARAIAAIGDPRLRPVRVEVDGPTTKGDCLNRLYAALGEMEQAEKRCAKLVVLHDAEDVVHPAELMVFDRLIEKASIIQLPVLPLLDRWSPWVGGHYCDEFAEAHGKEMVVREAVGASIPLAGVGCAVARDTLGRLAALHGGKPFPAGSMTEDYELGLRVGTLGERTMFVRLPTAHGEPGNVCSRGHFPGTVEQAVRQKARWIGGIAFAGWDRLGWHGGLGERWMRMRDRRGPLAALLLMAGYLAALLYAQIGTAVALGAPSPPPPSPGLLLLLSINAGLLAWRVLMRFGFTTAAYGLDQGLLAIPRMLVGNFIAILSSRRALTQYLQGGPKRWDKTAHIFPELTS
ncbi:glycosyl transferase family protein [Sphingomonas ginkgonis]|uniref:Glycosyl transferase family protein n=1 Tax=Sphingomonas ginkgonis TaxID=2315330 RepID=A0A3R9X665_9SPHN|nr:glycosyl transferase family protein [Sphingomonas ginkgonis]RST29713.1 glycosyl transferase family protein [Sphingomonas ginkgonis]